MDDVSAAEAERLAKLLADDDDDDDDSDDPFDGRLEDLVRQDSGNKAILSDGPVETAQVDDGSANIDSLQLNEARLESLQETKESLLETADMLSAPDNASEQRAPKDENFDAVFNHEEATLDSTLVQTLAPPQGSSMRKKESLLDVADPFSAQEENALDTKFIQTDKNSATSQVITETILALATEKQKSAVDVKSSLTTEDQTPFAKTQEITTETIGNAPSSQEESTVGFHVLQTTDDSIRPQEAYAGSADVLTTQSKNALDIDLLQTVDSAVDDTKSPTPPPEYEEESTNALRTPKELTDLPETTDVFAPQQDVSTASIYAQITQQERSTGIDILQNADPCTSHDLANPANAVPTQIKSVTDSDLLQTTDVLAPQEDLSTASINAQTAQQEMTTGVDFLQTADPFTTAASKDLAADTTNSGPMQVGSATDSDLLQTADIFIQQQDLSTVPIYAQTTQEGKTTGIDFLRTADPLTSKDFADPAATVPTPIGSITDSDLLQSSKALTPQENMSTASINAPTAQQETTTAVDFLQTADPFTTAASKDLAADTTNSGPTQIGSVANSDLLQTTDVLAPQEDMSPAPTNARTTQQETSTGIDFLQTADPFTASRDLATETVDAAPTRVGSVTNSDLLQDTEMTAPQQDHFKKAANAETHESQAADVESSGIGQMSTVPIVETTDAVQLPVPQEKEKVMISNDANSMLDTSIEAGLQTENPATSENTFTTPVDSKQESKKDSRNPFVDADELGQEQGDESRDIKEDKKNHLTAPYREQARLPLSLMVCAVGGGLRLRGGGQSWITYLSANVIWSQVAELAATVMFGIGLVCRPLCDGKCSSMRHACGPQLPALVFLRPQDTSSRLRFVVAAGATANKQRALVAGAVSVAPLELSTEDETLAATAVQQLQRAIETQISAASGVDPVFALDLERAFAAELEGNLRAYSEPLDRMARNEELRTAQAMALLTTAYSSAGVQIPRPQRAPPLSSFPLVGARPRLLGYFASEEEAEARAKKSIQEAIALGANSSAEIIQAIVTDLQAWCSAEAAARTKRKAAAVSARLRNAETHGRSLIYTLADDRKKRSTGRVSLFTSSAAERRFCSLFRVADTDRDALLYDCAALRVPSAGEGVIAGRLYVAASACYWHAKTLLPTGQADSQQVTPYYVLDAVELREGLLSSESAATPSKKEEQQPSTVAEVSSTTTRQFFGVAARRAASAVSIVASKAVEKVALNLADERLARVALIDAAGRDAAVFFLPPSPTVPDHAQRVVDLIRLAKKINDDTRKSALKTKETTDFQSHPNEESNEDELAILERVQKIALISARNARLLDEAKESSKPSTLDTATSVLSSSLSAAKAKSLDATSSFLKLSGFGAAPSEEPPPKDDAAIIADILSSAIESNDLENGVNDDELDLDMPPSIHDSSDDEPNDALTPSSSSTYSLQGAKDADLGHTFTPLDPAAAQRRLTMLQAFLDEAHQKQEEMT